MNTTEWETKTIDKPKFDDAAVGALALISIYQTATFLLLQLLVFIPGSIITLIFESLDWDKKIEEIIAVALIITINLVLIIVLAKKGKTRFERYMESRQIQNNTKPTDILANSAGVITEAHLEYSLGIAALVGIGWCLLFEDPIKSIQIFLTILEGAALLFLTIFVIIRFLMTKKIRPTAIICILLTCFSLWNLLQ